MNKLNNVNVNYLKIPKKHHRLHKMLLLAMCFRPLVCYTLLDSQRTVRHKEQGRDFAFIKQR